MFIFPFFYAFAGGRNPLPLPLPSFLLSCCPNYDILSPLNSDKKNRTFSIFPLFFLGVLIPHGKSPSLVPGARNRNFRWRRRRWEVKERLTTVDLHFLLMAFPGNLVKQHPWIITMRPKAEGKRMDLLSFFSLQSLDFFPLEKVGRCCEWRGRKK